MLLREANNLDELRATIDFLYGLVKSKEDCSEYIKEVDGSLHIISGTEEDLTATDWDQFAYILENGPSLDTELLAPDSVKALLKAGYISTAVIDEDRSYLVATRLGYDEFFA